MSFNEKMPASEKAPTLREQYPHAIQSAETHLKELLPVISEQALRALCKGDPTLEQLFNELIKYSCRYAADVMRMQEALIATGTPDSVASAEEFAQADASRTRLHNTTIDQFNILSRALARAGRDNEWRRELHGRADMGLLAVQLGIAHFLQMENDDVAH
ncbi:MAG: hypothetical protein JWN18_321 [Parcubacteria group bacterium]|nr:hypothetical protein [Parcubacteria group bacterium]